jgi:hypothetical protein
MWNDAKYSGLIAYDLASLTAPVQLSEDERELVYSMEEIADNLRGAARESK